MGDSPRKRSDGAVSAGGPEAAATSEAEQLPLHPSPPPPPSELDEESQIGRDLESAEAETKPKPPAELSASLQRALSPLPPPTYGEQCNIGSLASRIASTRIRFLPRELPAGMSSPSAMSSATMETHILDVESPGATLKRKGIQATYLTASTSHFVDVQGTSHDQDWLILKPHFKSAKKVNNLQSLLEEVEQFAKEPRRDQRLYEAQGGGIVYFPPENLAEYLDSSLVTPVSGGSAPPTSNDGNVRKRRTFFDECGVSEEDDPFVDAAPRIEPLVQTGTPSSKAALFYCAFCMRNRAATSRRRFTGNGGCSHEFCQICLENYLFQRIMVGHHSLHPCPKFGEESCRASASSEDIRRIVEANVYQAQISRLEGLSGACEECGHRGRRPSKHLPLSPPLQPAPASPPRAAAREDTDASEENTCQSCGSPLRRHLHLHHHHHHHHHNQEHHFHNLRTSPRRASTAAAARSQRKDSVKTPRGWRKNSAETRQQQQQQRVGALLAGGAGAAEESSQLKKQGRGGEETAGAPAAAATATIRCRGCPSCGHRQQQVSCSGSGGSAGVALTGNGTNNSTMAITSRPATATTTPTTPATVFTTNSAARPKERDVQDNLVVCDACGGAWCWLCGRSASNETDAVGGGGGGGVSRSGGYSKASTEQGAQKGQRRPRGGREESGRDIGCVPAGGGVARNGGRLHHFSRWNVAGCPGARYTDPKVWGGECLPLYRTLVAILVAMIGPVFLVSRFACCLVGVLLGPVCCAFGETARERWLLAFRGCRFGEWRTTTGAAMSVPDVICLPLAMALSLLLTVAWLPLGLVAAAARWLWTSVAADVFRPNATDSGSGGSGGGGGGGGDINVPVGRLALARQRRAATAAEARRVKEAKLLKLVAIAPAIVLSSYLASWWWWPDGSSGNGGGAGDGRREGAESGGNGDGMLADEMEELHMPSRPPLPPPTQELDPYLDLDETPVLLATAAAKGDKDGTPPLTVSPAKA